MLVTGGAGFIGRAVVRALLERGARVAVLDDLSNGREENLSEFGAHPGYLGLTIGDIRDRAAVDALFAKRKFSVCYHLAAQIVVQDSIDDPQATFESDVVGTFSLLEASRRTGARFVFMSTCMVYDTASGGAISETHPTKPASPYAACKLAGEALTLSYHFAYGLPTCVIRPFNTYGPFQKTGGEGGVVAVFLSRDLKGETLRIYGTGEQTRDLLYVDDCAEFVVRSGESDAVVGRILNAGTGADVSINELAARVCADPSRIEHVEHIHPQSEIMKLGCDARLAAELLDWRPATPLDEGLARTRAWLAGNGP